MPTSPYIKTPIKDNYRDILVKPFIDSSLDDTDYVIEKKYEYRPDRLAYDLYGDESLFFVFQLRNMDLIKDPIFDFKTGVKIKIPTQRNVNNMRFE
jgi:hypothetical protein